MLTRLSMYSWVLLTFGHLSTAVSSFTIALSFKLSYSYNRWWEAATALHNMHAKWLDVASTMAAFHLQSKMYEFQNS